MPSCESASGRAASPPASCLFHRHEHDVCSPPAPCSAFAAACQRATRVSPTDGEEHSRGLARGVQAESRAGIMSLRRSSTRSPTLPACPCCSPSLDVSAHGHGIVPTCRRRVDAELMDAHRHDKLTAQHLVSDTQVTG